MNKNVSISLANFSKLYYNVPWNDSKYLKQLIPDLKEVTYNDMY